MRFSRLAGVILGWVGRAWLWTLRLSVEAHPSLVASEDPRPWVLAFWHGKQFALYGWRRRRATVALVSRSRDGELLSSALGVLGVGSVRGSSSRGGRAGLLSMVRALRSGVDGAFAIDGPKGPRGVAKGGALVAARRARGVVVPMAAECRAKWVARSWDGFEVPWPFARVAVVLGEPLSADVSAERLAEAVHAASARARARLAGAEVSCVS